MLDHQVDARAGRQPIVATETSVAAVLGGAEQGPLHEPVTVTGLADFESVYGAVGSSPLGRAVADLFANGAQVAVTVRTEEVRTALGSLGTARFQLVVVDPALLGPGDLAEADAVCEERRAFLVVDADEDGVPAELVTVGARNAAAYGPRLVDEAGTPRPAAPAVAGMFARNDRLRGVWRASAGRTAEIVGAAGVERELNERELAALAARRVNALRRMPDGAVVVWGDRTVAADAEGKYVNVRRHLLCIEHSIEEGLQWALSEPNGEPLWERVRSDVTDFLLSLWRRGAFPGEKPSEGFYVRCDGSTMSEDDVRNGRLVVHVGVATMRPAEFVVVRVALTTGRTGAGPGATPRSG